LELENRYKVEVVQTAEEAIDAADAHVPDCVVTELALADHSAAGFFYEFRSYNEWQSIPVIVYTNQRISDAITNSKDWKLLNIAKLLYKPTSSLKELVQCIDHAVGQQTL
jgi:response regulator RpfG family c-di-GMP phosphodiesterase